MSINLSVPGTLLPYQRSLSDEGCSLPETDGLVNILMRIHGILGRKMLMKCQMGLSGIVLSLLLMSCASSVPAQPGQERVLSQQPTPTPAPVVSSSPTHAGQMLPISAQAAIRGQRILLEVARTRQQQQMGLMYRTSLADNRGMLFPFDPPQPVSFWMKNTKIPLDMIFLR
ncbi:MAG TPA: DUF192 domain-containing protein, partial [Stenomitos sp.]